MSSVELMRSGRDRLVRLQKIISQAGIASRRKAERLISEGRVTVNGRVARLGGKADPQRDRICIDQQEISTTVARRYFRLYKPRGYLTSLSDPRGRPVLTDLLGDIDVRVYPVGRLDFHSEGLLLLTNDGELTHALLHPSHQIPRTYHVKVRGEPSAQKLQRFLAGIPLEDGIAKALHVEPLRTTPAGHLWFELILTEGRNREVRRMCEAIGHPVSRLLRTHFAHIGIDDLKPGEVRPLSAAEIAGLYELAQLPPPRKTKRRRSKK